VLRDRAATCLLACDCSLINGSVRQSLVNCRHACHTLVQTKGAVAACMLDSLGTLPWPC